MSIQPTYPNSPKNNGKVFAGLILLVVGSLLLLRQFSFFFFPGWLFSFPTLLIVIGLYTGYKHNFKNPSWFIMVLIGTIFLSRHILPWFDLRDFVWPIGIIGLGLWLILRRNHTANWNDANNRFKKDAFGKDPVNFATEADYTVKPEGAPSNTAYENVRGDDVLDSVSIFGGVKKSILSKEFKGGEIVNIFGGAELDFTQADINGIVVIDITQIFGGVKLIVPPHWQVTSDIAAIFSGFDDKRFNKHNLQGPPNNNKLLVLKGTSIFAGVDIRSY
jgi:predicted membrane protein